MSDYSTISLPRKIKEILDKDRGDMDWGEYLLRLYTEAKEKRRREAFEKLRRTLSEEDLERILEEYKKFREEFKLR
ncbi:MAG: hypothetical protein J7J19_00480 [Thaumarchaeota archaeon]|nr:hypothetical protein [Nitrososphaerota archaeon]